MGAVAGALLNLQGKLGLRGWQWLFLVEGLPAVLLSAVFLKFLPNNPSEAAWLTAAERNWIESQLAAEGQDIPGGQPIRSQAVSSHATGVSAALRDIRVWLFGLTNLLMLGVNYAYSFSLPSIVKNLTSFDVTAGRLHHFRHGPSRRIRHDLQRMALRPQRQSLPAHDRPQHPRSDLPDDRRLHRQSLGRGPGSRRHVLCPHAIQGPLLALPSTILKGKGAAAGLATINMVGILGGVIGPPLMGWARDLTGSYQNGLAVLGITMLAAAGVVFALRTLSRRHTLELNANVHP